MPSSAKIILFGWPVSTAVLGPLALPIYFATRNLREGEIREGGAGWSWARERSLGLPHAVKGELKSRPGDRLWRDEKSLASGGYLVEVHDGVPATDSP